MGSHPLNLLLRFFLEMAALSVAAYWAWHISSTWEKYLFTAALPLFLAMVWGVFAVPNDPSRSGKTVIAVAGYLRLIIELAIFGFAVWALVDLQMETIAIIFGLTIVLHYFASYDRIKWLIKQ